MMHLRNLSDPTGKQTIKRTILDYLRSSSQANFDELAALFQYKAYRSTINSELYNLEREGKIIYSPRTCTYSLPN